MSTYIRVYTHTGTERGVKALLKTLDQNEPLLLKMLYIPASWTELAFCAAGYT